MSDQAKRSAYEAPGIAAMLQRKRTEDIRRFQHNVQVMGYLGNFNSAAVTASVVIHYSTFNSGPNPSGVEPTFWVHKRMFATFASARNHHGAGRDAVWCKAAHMTQEMVVARWPDRYFVPPYVGHRGWVGVRLDTDPDWDRVADVIEAAYRTSAPASLLRQL